MNSLSWMIYFADISSDIHFSILLILFIFAAIMIVGIVLRFEQNNSGLFYYAVKKIPFISFLLAISIILPSKNTIYAIAASELGEKVVASQLSTKAQKAIDAWLDRQIKGDSKP